MLPAGKWLKLKNRRRCLGGTLIVYYVLSHTNCAREKNSMRCARARWVEKMTVVAEQYEMPALH